MLIILKNKDQLIVDDFIFKCAIGKRGVKSKKREGDKATPKGTFSFGKLFYRADRVKMPKVKINTKAINKNMGWCDDPKGKLYNKEIKIPSKQRHERLFKKSGSYDFFIPINYNTKRIVPYKGSAIFLHLTKNYRPTNGCIAVKKKDFLIILKLINKKTRIKIF